LRRFARKNLVTVEKDREKVMTLNKKCSNGAEPLTRRIGCVAVLLPLLADFRIVTIVTGVIESRVEMANAGKKIIARFILDRDGSTGRTYRVLAEELRISLGKACFLVRTLHASSRHTNLKFCRNDRKRYRGAANPAASGR
jgi:hypothetical protein